MALQKWGQKDSGQYSVYNLPTSNLDLLRTRHIQQDKDGEIR